MKIAEMVELLEEVISCLDDLKDSPEIPHMACVEDLRRIATELA